MKKIKKSDFQRFSLGAPTPWCPLCIKNANATEHKMERHYVEARRVMVFKCDRYKVAVRVDDPMVGKWEFMLARIAAEDRPKCPVPSCQAEMRYFATSVGYMKAACPAKGCGATMASGEVREKPVEGSLVEKAESGEGTVGVDKVYTPEKPGSLQ